MAIVSLEEYNKALEALNEAMDRLKSVSNEVDYKITRDACIQRFEFCIELAWKTAKKVLGSSSTTAKPVVREMAQNELVQDVDLWFRFIEARNKSSHTYDEDIAKEVMVVVQVFLHEGQKLLKAMRNK